MGLNFGIEVAYRPLASEHGLTLLRLRPENPSDSGREPPPARTLFDKLFSPSLGQGVEPGFPVICRSAPASVNPPLRFQPLEGGIERAVFDQQCIFRCLLNGPRDALPVLRAKYQRPQDEKVQRALEQCQPFSFLSGRHTTQPYAPSGKLSTQREWKNVRPRWIRLPPAKIRTHVFSSLSPTRVASPLQQTSRRAQPAMETRPKEDTCAGRGKKRRHLAATGLGP